jgi:hypothetical protein
MFKVIFVEIGQIIKGTIKVMWQSAKEDWFLMDKKLMRIISYAVGLALAAAFWWFFLRGSMPF